MLSCSGLGCSENAECVLDTYGGPVCACFEGFEGDGTVCTPVPSRVKMYGYSKPEEVVYASGIVQEQLLKCKASRICES